MRTEYNMNFNWKFHYGDITTTNFNSVHDTFENPSFMKSANCGISKAGYDIGEWEDVQIPHDLRHAKATYDKDNIPSSQGFLTTGIAWYRKEFFIDRSEKGKSFTLEFDGVFRDSEIYVNGTFVGRHLSGYTSFNYDISDFIFFGENNAIAVRVDATKFEGWWYEAGGIYRDVRLVLADRLKVKENGVFVISTPTGDNAKIDIAVELENESTKAGNATLTFDIFDNDGVNVKSLSQDFTVEEYEEQTVSVSTDLENIKRWDVDSPNQYKVVISVSYDGAVVDTYTQKFGIREVIFSAEKGVLLNGRQVKVQGVCVHDDFAGVGGAMSRSVIRHKIFLLKELGCNGYRCSHNPPSPYVLEACDDYGILVMDEVRLMSSSKEYLTQMTDLIKRDRNHPCVFIWSIGNEEMAVHGTEFGVEVVNHMLRIAHKTDPTRKCTYANNCNWKELTVYHEEHGLHMDVFGFNYYCMRHFDSYDYIHNLYPNTPIIGTENGSALVTRGQYLPVEAELNPDYYSDLCTNYTIWSKPERKYNVSAYGDTYTTWGSTPMETMKAADKDFVSGYFIWTGFDYRGETIPFQWPSVVSRFGIIDLCGFTKENGNQYKVKWSNKPSIYMYPHWTFDDNVGELQIDIVSNTDEVELFVNGVSQGRRVSPLRELVTYMVPYKAGEIKAIAYNNGEEVNSISYKTASEPKSIKLEIVQDREYIANGEDNVFIKMEVLDKDGVHCPNANNLITFEVEGAGQYLGCGNGDALCLDDDQKPQRNLFNGLALAILRTSRETGKLKFTAKSEGLESASVEVDVTIPYSDILAPEPIANVVIAEREKDDSDGAF